MGIIRKIKKSVSLTVSRLAPNRWKEFSELRYWKGRKKSEGVLTNDHYEYFYTGHFGLDRAYYSGKVIVDIGCGPRGSLEWAESASRRIGVDPLADQYLKLGASEHSMEYLGSPSENIPLEDGSCDAVFSFNSLDHVEDIDRTIAEIKRITRPGSIFLLLVEVNHEPTACEPHRLTPEGLIQAFAPEFKCTEPVLYTPIPGIGMYESIQKGVTIRYPDPTGQVAYFSAKFVR